MTRTTRAAQKAQETEIHIAEDATSAPSQDEPTTIATLQEKKTGPARPPLVEMTANAVEELSQAIDVKHDGRKGTVRGKKARAGTRRGGPKSKEQDESSEASVQSKTASEMLGRDENENPGAEDQDVSAKSSASDSTELATAEKNDPTAGAPLENVSADSCNGVKSEEPLVEAIAQQSDKPQAEPVPETQPATIQKLESIFTEPHAEAADSTKQANALLATAAARPLPPSPEKRASASPQRSTKSSASKTQTTQVRTKSAPKDTVKGKSPGIGKRTSIVAIAPRMSVRGGARNSTVGPSRTSTVNQPRQSIASEASPFLKDKKERTIAALNTPPKLAKSNKAPTASTFQLPSEALKEKFKAQKEERQKRQEEQAQKQKRKENAKPSIPPKHTTKPREAQGTIARHSRASISGQMRGASTPSVSDKVRPNRPQASTIRSARPAPIIADKKRSTATVRNPRPAGGRISSVSKPMIERSGEHRQSVTIKPTEVPTMTPAQKAEAAKRARAEAAEKGRAASREWAEKKKREVEAKKAAQAVELVVVPS